MIVRSRRLSRQLTIRAVAEAVSVDKGTVWRWEHERSRPSRKHRVELARLLGGQAGDYGSTP